MFEGGRKGEELSQMTEFYPEDSNSLQISFFHLARIKGLRKLDTIVKGNFGNQNQDFQTCKMNIVWFGVFFLMSCMLGREGSDLKSEHPS